MPYEQTTDVTLPEEKKVVETPSGTSVSNAFFDYAMRYEPTPGGIRFKRTFRLKRYIVPAAEYQAFRKDVLAVVEADKVTLAFR